MSKLADRNRRKARLIDEIRFVLETSAKDKDLLEIVKRAKWALDQARTQQSESKRA